MNSTEKLTVPWKEAAKAIKEAEKAEANAAREAERHTQAMAQAFDRMYTRLGRMTIRFLIDEMKEAISYASQYYDKMNEIRTVTGKTEAEANRLGESFRKMAKDLKVTSTELASSAVTFYRQGLSDTEVKKRMEWTTKYAKVANIDFESAATLITAATNSMGLEAEKVADVFLYLGDAAGTSGEEIGKAMQKASASAQQFGLSFEWLGAYIATVSEQTRQAPESIGNAFNTMMARLHSIKEQGFNSEDATTLNNVAKALKEIGVELMEGNDWRAMSDIFSDISEKWSELDDKQQSYIATTMAGTRMQNVFFALMNDLSKGVEGGSRALELYTGAMNSAGTATKKYSVYQESVAAAQAELAASFEELYSALDPNIIKGYYSTLSGIVGLLAKGTKAMGGLNVVIGVVTAGIVALTLASIRAGSVLAAFMAHPVISGVLAATTAIGLITAAVGMTSEEPTSVQSSTEIFNDATAELQNAKDNIDTLKKYQTTLNSLFEKQQDGVKMTSGELKEYNDILNAIAATSPRAAKAVEELRNGLGDQAAAAKSVKQELQDMIAVEQALERAAAAKRLGANEYLPQDQSPSRMYLSQQTYESALGAAGTTFTTPAQIYHYLDQLRANAVQVGEDPNRKLVTWGEHGMGGWAEEQALEDYLSYMRAFSKDNMVTWSERSNEYFATKTSISDATYQRAVNQIIDDIMLQTDKA